MKITDYRTFDFILFSLTLYITLLFLAGNLDCQGFNYVPAQLRRMGDAVLLSLPVYCVKKKKYLFPYLTLINIFLLVNIWYYRNYGSFIPLSSYLLIQNLDGLAPSVMNSIKVTDVFLLFPSALFMLYYSICRRSNLCCKFEYSFFLLALFYVFSVQFPSFFIHSSLKDYNNPIALFKFEPIRAYKQFGFIPYWLSQVNALKRCTNEEINKAKRVMKKMNEDNKMVEPLSGNARGKNLIVILVESLQSWPIKLKINGKYIMPKLNDIIKEDNTVYFSKVLPQVKDGRSADAQLLINTGLLPIREGATCSLYATNTYIGLPLLMKKYNYFSASFICDDKSYWNQVATSKSYGFDVLYDNLGQSGNIRYRSDEFLFKNALPKLKNLKTPFYAQLVTYSGHDIVKTDFNSWIYEENLPNVDVKYNLAITEYVDQCIGNFIEELKLSGIYKESIIIITGDHDFVTYNRYEGRKNCELEDRFIPFIIVNSPFKVETGNVIAQSDIFPTLLDLMGIQSVYRGLGESVFRNQCGFAVYRDYSVVGNCMNDSNILFKQNLWNVSDVLIRINYFREN